MKAECAPAVGLGSHRSIPEVEFKDIYLSLSMLGLSAC